MGRYITFQCETCFRYWIITGSGLEPLQVFRSPAPGDSETETLLLPFWIIPIDSHLLRHGISQAREVLPGSELNYLLDRIESHDRYSIFVPAFQATNTFAYLKIGKLLTRKQPPFRLVRAEDPGRPVMCALHPEEAVQLMDFIFIATLPESIQESGDFLKDVHLNATSPPRLVELPFEIRGSALYSVVGGFEISSRLVELPHAEKNRSY